MLQAAGIHCEGNLHFWLTADGSYQHEGMKNVMGKLWEKVSKKPSFYQLPLSMLMHFDDI